ncbi:MAG: DUF5615 family PIN-like protein [Planctomycetota bacterium]
MKLLLDECLPVQLRKWLPEHEVHTAKWAKLDHVTNGHLLSAAENIYDVLITVDRNMRNQNKISKYNLGVILVLTKRTKPDEIWPKVEAIKDALKRIKKGQVIVVGETESGL